VTFAEAAALAHVPANFVRTLKMCRLATAPIDATEFERWLKGEADISVGGLPALTTLPVSVEQPRNRRDNSPRPTPRDASPKDAADRRTVLRCRYCKETVKGTYADHNKICKDPKNQKN